MKSQKVIIVKDINVTPEEKLNERLAELGDEYRVVSANTTMATHGDMGDLGRPRHVVYVTTVIVDKSI